MESSSKSFITQSIRIRTQIASSTDEAQKTKLQALLEKEIQKRDAALKALKDLEACFAGTEFDKTVRIYAHC